MRSSITAAAPVLALWSRAAFIAIAGKGEGLFGNGAEASNDDLVGFDAIFKFTDTRRSDGIWLTSGMGLLYF